MFIDAKMKLRNKYVNEILLIRIEKYFIQNDFQELKKFLIKNRNRIRVCKIENTEFRLTVKYKNDDVILNIYDLYHLDAFWYK